MAAAVVDDKEARAVAAAVSLARGKLVYVGSAGGLQSKALLAPLLRSAATANLPPQQQPPPTLPTPLLPLPPPPPPSPPLVIFGAGWGEEAEWAPYWGGVLPHSKEGPSALGAVYEASFAVLGATMDDQREYGMVNNRVFEVLAAGALLITEHFPELEALLGPWTPSDPPHTPLHKPDDEAAFPQAPTATTEAAAADRQGGAPPATSPPMSVHLVSPPLSDGAGVGSAETPTTATTAAATAGAAEIRLVSGSGALALGGAACYIRGDLGSVAQDLNACVEQATATDTTATATTTTVSRGVSCSGCGGGGGGSLAWREAVVAATSAAEAAETGGGGCNGSGTRGSGSSGSGSDSSSSGIVGGDGGGGSGVVSWHKGDPRAARKSLVASRHTYAHRLEDVWSLVGRVVAVRELKAVQQFGKASHRHDPIGALLGFGQQPTGKDEKTKKSSPSRDHNRDQFSDPLFAFYPYRSSAFGEGGGLPSRRLVDLLNRMTPACLRPKCPRLAVVAGGLNSAPGDHGTDAFSAEFATTTLPALMRVAATAYSIQWVDASSVQRLWLPPDREAVAAAQEEEDEEEEEGNEGEAGEATFAPAADKPSYVQGGTGGEEGDSDAGGGDGEGDDEYGEIGAAATAREMSARAAASVLAGVRGVGQFDNEGGGDDFQSAGVNATNAGGKQEGGGWRADQADQGFDTHRKKKHKEKRHHDAHRLSGHWHLDTAWANTFDMVWALGCPGGVADLVVRSLPDATTMAGGGRIRALLLHQGIVASATDSSSSSGHGSAAGGGVLPGVGGAACVASLASLVLPRPFEAERVRRQALNASHRLQRRRSWQRQRQGLAPSSSPPPPPSPSSSSPPSSPAHDYSGHGHSGHGGSGGGGARSASLEGSVKRGLAWRAAAEAGVKRASAELGAQLRVYDVVYFHDGSSAETVRSVLGPPPPPPSTPPQTSDASFALLARGRWDFFSTAFHLDLPSVQQAYGLERGAFTAASGGAEEDDEEEDEEEDEVEVEDEDDGGDDVDRDESEEAKNEDKRNGGAISGGGGDDGGVVVFFGDLSSWPSSSLKAVPPSFSEKTPASNQEPASSPALIVVDTIAAAIRAALFQVVDHAHPADACAKNDAKAAGMEDCGKSGGVSCPPGDVVGDTEVAAVAPVVTLVAVAQSFRGDTLKTLQALARKAWRQAVEVRGELFCSCLTDGDDALGRDGGGGKGGGTSCCSGANGTTASSSLQLRQRSLRWSVRAAEAYHYGARGECGQREKGKRTAVRRPPRPPKKLPCISLASSPARSSERQRQRHQGGGDCPLRISFVGLPALRRKEGGLAAMLANADLIFLPFSNGDDHAGDGGGGDGGGGRDWAVSVAASFASDLNRVLFAPPPLTLTSKPPATLPTPSTPSASSAAAALAAVSKPVGGSEEYASSLVQGTTRALCLGRGRTKVAFTASVREAFSERVVSATSVHAADGTTSTAPNTTTTTTKKTTRTTSFFHSSSAAARLWLSGPSSSSSSTKAGGGRGGSGVVSGYGELREVVVRLDADEFHVGRDGSWCLFANRHLVACVMQPGLNIRLAVEKEGGEDGEASDSAANDGDGGEDSGLDRSRSEAQVGASEKRRRLRTRREFDVVLEVELRSGIYADVVRRSQPITLRLREPPTPPSPPASPPSAWPSPPSSSLSSSSSPRMSAQGQRRSFFGGSPSVEQSILDAEAEEARFLMASGQEERFTAWSFVLGRVGKAPLEFVVSPSTGKPLTVHVLGRDGGRSGGDQEEGGGGDGGRSGSKGDVNDSGEVGESAGDEKNEEDRQEGEGGIALKFTAHDDLEAVALAFIRLHGVDGKVGAGCEAGQTQCMVRNFANVMRDLVDAAATAEEGGEAVSSNAEARSSSSGSGDGSSERSEPDDYGGAVRSEGGGGDDDGNGASTDMAHVPPQQQQQQQQQHGDEEIGEDDDYSLTSLTSAALSEATHATAVESPARPTRQETGETAAASAKATAMHEQQESSHASAACEQTSAVTAATTTATTKHQEAGDESEEESAVTTLLVGSSVSSAADTLKETLRAAMKVKLSAKLEEAKQQAKDDLLSGHAYEIADGGGKEGGGGGRETKSGSGGAVTRARGSS